MSKPRGSKNKKKNKKGIAPFEITHEANILRETPEGGFVTDDFVPIEKIKSTLKIMGKIYHGEGMTIIEAIKNIDAKNVRGRGILVLEKNGIRKEKVLFPSMTLRLFGPASPLSKEIVLKQMSQLFDKAVFEA